MRYWITHNEPWVVAYLGHYLGEHAPGIRDLATAVRVSHHLLVSHGLATRAIRALSPHAQVGIALNLSPVVPASDSDSDRAAAQAYDGILNRWFLDPLFGRGYPRDTRQLLARFFEPPESDCDTIAEPLDFLGVNYYTPAFVTAAPEGSPQGIGLRLLSPEELRARGYELTDMGWAIVPDGLEQLLVRLQREYRPPAIVITENGAAFPDEPVDGRVQDDQRIAYLAAHVAAVHRALEAGVPVGGYFVWSLLDNFEWAHGYSKRFGIVYVDYTTLARVPKASFDWYRTVIANRALPDG